MCVYSFFILLCICVLSGLLDIYGFESFSENSLEQLCINYANERLQQYFVQYYLRDLQAEYAEENVPWQHVDMTSDNKSCVQLMSANPSIFSFLNEVHNTISTLLPLFTLILDFRDEMSHDYHICCIV